MSKSRKLRTGVTLSLLVTMPVTLTACGEEWIEQESTAYEQCLLAEVEEGLDIDCEDDDADWYKLKGYKSKYAKTKIYKSSSGMTRSGFGSSGGYSSGG
jgi:hypothetical protein